VLRSVEHFHRAGDHTSVRLALLLAVGVLNALGDHEAGALLSGTTSVAHQITSGGQPAGFLHLSKPDSESISETNVSPNTLLAAMR
jgi:hypothetical protein